MRLSDTVTKEDAQTAVYLLGRSVIWVEQPDINLGDIAAVVTGPESQTSHRSPVLFFVVCNKNIIIFFLSCDF